ncbi:hypothetical protein ES705_11863 [subsurface metagenome]
MRLDVRYSGHHGSLLGRFKLFNGDASLTLLCRIHFLALPNRRLFSGLGKSIIIRSICNGRRRPRGRVRTSSHPDTKS